MALEARNMNAYRILAIMDEGHKKHAILASLFVEEKGSAIERGTDKKLMGMSGKQMKVAAGLIMGAATVALFTLLLKRFLDAGVNPLDPEADKPSTWERVKEAVGLGKKEEPVAAEPTPTVTQVATNKVETSPLISQDQLVPYKTAKSTQAVRDAIREGAGQVGVDYSLMYGIAGAESSFREDVSAHTGSAQGLFQFTKDTWSYMMKLYPDLGYSMEDRNDKKKAAHVASLYVARIQKTLTQVLGRKPSYGETYLGYFLGPTGGARLINALRENPNAIGAKLFPKAAKANPNVFYKNGDTTQPMTLAEILGKLEGKIVSYANESEKTNTSSPSQVGQAPAVDSKSSAPASSQSTVNADAVTKANTVATSKQEAGSVALPSADVTNKRQLAKREKEVAARTKDQPVNDPAPVVDGSIKRKDANTTLIRGKDGRLYQTNS